MGGAFKGRAFQFSIVVQKKRKEEASNWKQFFFLFFRIRGEVGEVDEVDEVGEVGTLCGMY